MLSNFKSLKMNKIEKCEKLKVKRFEDVKKISSMNKH